MHTDARVSKVDNKMLCQFLLRFIIFYSQLAEDAGFPPGVVNTIPCSRDNVNQVTDALLGNDIVAKMSFTGSTATGKV